MVQNLFEPWGCCLSIFEWGWHQGGLTHVMNQILLYKQTLSPIIVMKGGLWLPCVLELDFWSVSWPGSVAVKSDESSMTWESGMDRIENLTVTFGLASLWLLKKGDKLYINTLMCYVNSTRKLQDCFCTCVPFWILRFIVNQYWQGITLLLILYSYSRSKRQAFHDLIIIDFLVLLLKFPFSGTISFS